MKCLRQALLNRAPAAWLTVMCLVGALSGCVSKKNADQRARAAYEAGRRQAAVQSEAEGNGVQFRGPVQNPLVVWRPGLTLVQALLEAVYVGAQDPKLIIVERDGERNYIDAADLLRGVDYEVQPGDVVILQAPPPPNQIDWFNPLDSP